MRRVIVIFCGLALSPALTVGAEAPGSHFAFDKTAQGVVSGATITGDLEYADETPAPFIYDPLTKRSRPNQASLNWTGATTATALSAGFTGSFTLEAFVKPLNAVDGAYVRKSRKTPEAAECGLKLDHFQAHNQFYLRAFVVPARKPGLNIWTGYYGSAAQYRGEQDVDWRHLALVYDETHRTVTSYVDYYLAKTETLADPLTFDDGPLVIGAPRLQGLIDEVRLTPRALRTAHFLRATTTPLQNVSFESTQTIVPADAGCLDVKEHFGAVGDGMTDDTAAFQAAFRALSSKVPLAYNTLLVPPGRYLITSMIQGGRFIDVKGAGPDQTILQLKDGVFTDPDQPQPMLRMSSSQGAPGSYGGVNGSSISIYLDGMTFDTGKNNPGARGLEFHANNVGRLENVVIRSGDGQGVCGLDLTHHDCGPALVKHVTVLGFDNGVHSRYQEYSMTFEHLRLRGQRKAAILNQGNILAIRDLVSENAVPAIVCEGANTMVALLDSQLVGGDKSVPAIRTDGGLYALRVKTAGYQSAVAQRTLINQKSAEWTESTIAGPDLAESVSSPIVTGFGQATGALKLPIEETPEPPARPLGEWVNILQFSEKKQGDDWGPVLQAAIDSGARVLYLPANHGLQCATPVILRGNVERIVGLGNELRWSRAAWTESRQREQTDPGSAPPPLLIFKDPDARRTVWIDRLGIQSLQHASPGTLVLRSSSPDRYTTGVAGGRLFAEDIGGADWHFDHPQTVWVRQWNPESHAAGPCITSRGATIWSLGFKTEYESQKLLAEAGATTEILGAFIYPIGKIPAERPIFENRNSRMAVMYGTSVYQSNHKLHIRDVRGRETKEFGNDALKWAGSRARMDLFVTE